MTPTITLASLHDTPIWVSWQTEDRDDGKPPTKVPYAPDGRRAAAGVPATWGTRRQAEARAARLPKPYGQGGAGIEFTALGDGRSLGGIDLDTCRDPSTGAIEPWARAIAESFNSYTEISPSGTGIKIFFTYATSDLEKLRATMGGTKFGKQFKRGGSDHPPAIELYLGNRYFAITDQSLNGFPIEFRHVETDTLLRLLQITGPAFASGSEELRGDDQSKKRKTGATDRSRSALAFAKGKALRRAGKTFAQTVEALRADPETAEWTKEKGDANGQRELRRIWEKAEPKGAVIRVVAGELHITATEAEDALIASPLPIYQRGTALVRPISHEVPATKGRTTVAAGLADLSVHNVVDALCATAEFEKYDARAEDWVRVNPPTQVAQILLARHGQWRLPPIAGVITTPTLRPDGTLLRAPGYDPATRLYHVNAALDLSTLPNAPTYEDAGQALTLLKGLLEEFPLVSAVDEAVALSGLITPVVRGAVSVAPLHAAKATTAGTGKSYLIDIISAISTGRICPVASAGEDPIETEKRLVGLLLAGYPVVSLDNVNGELGGDLLCQAVERPLVRVRALGRSEMFEIESRATIYATGNGLRVFGDMVRRTLLAVLDAGIERPELRKFKADPVATVLVDRGRYVAACLTIVLAYQRAGCPGQLTPLASFEDWSNLIRSALVWLGEADPCLSMESAREDDPELSALREVLGLWRSAIGTGMDKAQTVRYVAEKASGRAPTQIGEPTDFQYPDLRDALLRIAGVSGTINTKKLGNWLADKEGRIAAGSTFKRHEVCAPGGVTRWAVMATAG